MENNINSFDLEKFEEYVTPVDLLWPPNYWPHKPGWPEQKNSIWLQRLLDTTEKLISYNEENEFYELAKYYFLDETNIREYTIKNYEAFLGLVEKYRSEYNPE